MGRSAQGGTVIAFRAGLGFGKTQITKGIALGLDISTAITSPTYTIISEYQGRLKLYHIDVYRLDSPDEFVELGGVDYLFDPEAVTVVEWSEKIAELMPSHSQWITIEMLSPTVRKILF